MKITKFSKTSAIYKLQIFSNLGDTYSLNRRRWVNANQAHFRVFNVEVRELLPKYIIFAKESFYPADLMDMAIGMNDEIPYIPYRIL